MDMVEWGIENLDAVGLRFEDIDALTASFAVFLCVWVLSILFASSAGVIVYLPLVIAVYLGTARLIMGGAPQAIRTRQDA